MNKAKMNNHTLLILAAGMGSRYGGLKQMDKLGQGGETIIDYSIYDAVNAGFNKIIFVIRKDIEADFKSAVIDKFKDKIAVDYVLQELDCLPTGFFVPEDRQKPWGTAHAILMAKDKIDDFFTVINGDDFYGKNAFVVIANYLSTLSLDDKNACFMVAYRLDNTLSENGTVSRGICTVDDDFYLQKVVEHTQLKRDNGKIFNYENELSAVELSPDLPVSMNFFGFHPIIFEHIEQLFVDFLQKNCQNPKSEFYIPFVVDDLIRQQKICVKVLQTDAQWYGITYREDRQLVMDKFKEMVDNQIYPSVLWQ
jgi:choline kinase